MSTTVVAMVVIAVVVVGDLVLMHRMVNQEVATMVVVALAMVVMVVMVYSAPMGHKGLKSFLSRGVGVVIDHQHQKSAHLICKGLV